MKTKKSNTPLSKSTLIISVVIAVLIVGVGAYFVVAQQNKSSKESASLPVDSDTQQAKNLSNDPKNKETPPNTDTPEPTKLDDNSGKSVVSMTVSTSLANNIVYIRGGINNAVVTDGTCYAQFTSPNGQTIRKDTTLLQNASTTDCKTISFSSSELSTGTWKVKLYYTSGDIEGVSNEVDIEIK